jgi:hypothetical protein
MIHQIFLKKEIFKSIKMKILQINSQRKMKLILGLLLFTFATLAFAGGNPYISNAHQGSDGYNRRDGSNKNTYDSQYGKKNQNDYLDQNQHTNYYNQDRNDREAAENYRQKNNVAENDYKKRNIHANEVDDTDAGKYKLKFNKDHQNKNDRFKNTKYQDNVNDLYSTDNDHVNKYSKRNHQKNNAAKNSYADHSEAEMIMYTKIKELDNTEVTESITGEQEMDPSRSINNVISLETTQSTTMKTIMMKMH